MALPNATNSYAVTDPNAASGIIYIVADPQTVAGNVSVIPWARIVSLAGDNADLASILSRLPLLGSDTQLRAGFAGILTGLVNPSGTVDATRSLATSGAGLGVELNAGTVFSNSSTTGGASLSVVATTPTTIFTSSEAAAKRRTLVIGSSLSQVVTITVWVQTGAASSANVAAYHTLFTMPAGNSVNQLVIATSGGIKPLGLTAGTLSAAPTVTTDGSSQLDAPLTSFTVKASVAATATGNLFVDYQAVT